MFKYQFFNHRFIIYKFMDDLWYHERKFNFQNIITSVHKFHIIE